MAKSAAYKVLLSSDFMDQFSYTCDALGGDNNNLLREMIFGSDSATEFISKFNNSPLKELYDSIEKEYHSYSDEEDIHSYPFANFFDACEMLERYELICEKQILALKVLGDNSEQTKNIIRKIEEIKNSSGEKMKRILNSYD